MNVRLISCYGAFRYIPECLNLGHPPPASNPRIANIFFLYGFVERWGYGTNRIIELCTKSGLKEPEFIEEAFFKTVIYRSSLNELEKEVLESVRNNMNTTASVARKLKINERTARKYLSSLVSKGLI